MMVEREGLKEFGGGVRGDGGDGGLEGEGGEGGGFEGGVGVMKRGCVKMDRVFFFMRKGGVWEGEGLLLGKDFVCLKIRKVIWER